MQTQRKPSAGEILRLFRTAGFATLTPLQKRLVPLIISGREKAPDTAAIMLAGWKYLRWKATTSSRAIDFTEASVVKWFVKWSSP